MISLCTLVVASGMIEWAQKAISLPVSRVSPRPRFDRNHWRLSSTKLTRQMGTFKAVPQSAVMRSNSWWRGVSSLRFGMGGRGRVDGRAGGVSRRGRGFRNGTLVSYSSKERSVDMRSSSSSGRGQDIFVSSEPFARVSLSGAAPARQRSSLAPAGHG